MLKYLFNCFLVTASLFVMTYAQAGNLPEKILNMPIELLSGKNITLADYRNKKPVYLKFWATWCQPCMKEMPHFQHVQSHLGNNIEVIAVNLGINDDRDAIKLVQKKFGLNMKMTIDSSGDLAQAFRLLGTPYHVLIDKHSNLIHVGNEASIELDNKMTLLVQQDTVDHLDAVTIQENAKELELDLLDGNFHFLYFTAAWCDWYLKDSRSALSKSCISAQKTMNIFSQNNKSTNIHGIISRLWTGETELKKYREKYDIKHSLLVDYSNRLFHEFGVKTFPTLVVIRNGQVIMKTSKLESMNELISQLDNHSIKYQNNVAE